MHCSPARRSYWLWSLSLSCAIFLPGCERLADPLARDQLVAWCIVPFDAAQRTPEQRAQMLQELGLKRCAYDWRDVHVPTFEEEILQYQRHGIELFAFWEGHEQAFALFEKYKLHPQIWKTAESPAGESDEQRIALAVEKIRSLAEKTRQLGCPLGLYNHGGWGGEPRNLVAVCERLRSEGFSHVGIVYNFHHGHGHIADWAESFRMLQPYLLCLNLDGMNSSGEPRILGIGKGEHEAKMLQVVLESGYPGPFGILNHRAELDARTGLLENLEGLAEVQRQLQVEQDYSSSPALKGLTADQHKQVRTLVESTPAQGDVLRGAELFSSARLACLQCHQVLGKGGTVGPDLSQVGRLHCLPEIIASVYWPRHLVKPEYVSWSIATERGDVLTGYRRNETAAGFDLFNPATATTRHLTPQDVEQAIQVGTLMPEGQMALLSTAEQADLFRFLSELGRTTQAQQAAEAMRLPVHIHEAAKFPYTAEPLHPEDHLNASLPVNENQLYDFYSKAADYFRQQSPVPPLLVSYPGLDGGRAGHWGRQSEAAWKDNRWNETDLGSFQSGVFRAGDLTIPRAMCVRLGEQGELSACFNPDTLSYELVWKNGFLQFSDVRHGFLGGILLKGDPIGRPEQSLPPGKKTFQGLYRHGRQVAFAYRIGDVDYLDVPGVSESGNFERLLAPVKDHPCRIWMQGGPAQWPQELTTKVLPGPQRPYAIDTFEIPFDNPWKSLLYFGGHDFLPDGSLLLCTMQGDVWHVTESKAEPGKESTVRWKRMATGLHQALGLVVADGVPYVLGRDQITRLHDFNHDGEADFYECFSNAWQTSPAGHDFICGLERDDQGRFYLASGNQGLVRISADGKSAEVIATGFRNPDGLSLLPDGRVTVPCSEGDWTPASTIAVCPAEPAAGTPVPHFGYGGPRPGQAVALPLVYLPRGLDNSAGGQVFVGHDRFGPLSERLLHFSFGTGHHFAVLEDNVNGQRQGAVVPLPGDFRSGGHRARVSPVDGQVYVTGMNGWTCFTPDDGCLHRIRYTGEPVQMPTAFHVHENGVAVEFALPVDTQIAAQTANQFAQCWNYRFSAGYGSPELSPSLPGMPGHEPLRITSVQVLSDARKLFVEIPDLQPVSQLHLRLQVDNSGRRHDLFATVHALDRPLPVPSGSEKRVKLIRQIPLLADLSRVVDRRPNPWAKVIKNAHKLTVQTGQNLTFATPVLRAKAGEPIALTLINPDVVPHNLALIKPGTLQQVGNLANQVVGDPDAPARQYVPESEDVLAYTDIVDPGGKFTIYFQAPAEPGKYPYLCTFPGHWMVMNGVLIVE